MIINHIIYVVLCTLLQLLVKVKSQTTPTIVDLREGHTATFINDKLYILGGAIPPFDGKVSPKETFFYLDCSTPFNTSELKWIDLSNNGVIPPSHYFAAAARGGERHDTLFLYGGESLGGGPPMSPVYTFNTLNNTWNVPIVAGESPSGRVFITPIVDNNGLIYLYGGATNMKGYYTNDTFILDSIYLNWKKVNSTNAPSPRVAYGAVLLSDKSTILYMGM